jgi:hypothetical protein
MEPGIASNLQGNSDLVDRINLPAAQPGAKAGDIVWGADAKEQARQATKIIAEHIGLPSDTPLTSDVLQTHRQKIGREIASSTAAMQPFDATKLIQDLQAHRASLLPPGGAPTGSRPQDAVLGVVDDIIKDLRRQGGVLPPDYWTKLTRQDGPLGRLAAQGGGLGFEAGKVDRMIEDAARQEYANWPQGQAEAALAALDRRTKARQDYATTRGVEDLQGQSTSAGIVNPAAFARFAKAEAPIGTQTWQIGQLFKDMNFPEIDSAGNPIVVGPSGHAANPAQQLAAVGYGVPPGTALKSFGNVRAALGLIDALARWQNTPERLQRAIGANLGEEPPASTLLGQVLSRGDSGDIGNLFPWSEGQVTPHLAVGQNKLDFLGGSNYQAPSADNGNLKTPPNYTTDLPEIVVTARRGG